MGPLPPDIWLIIIQYVDAPTVKSLSLVNELLRDVALPVVFDTLNITAPTHIYSSVKYRLYLEQVLQHVRGIGAVPRVLNAIRRLNLISWDIDRLERDATIYSTDAEIIKLISIVYEAIAQLVSSLPRLYRLDCQSCSLTPTLASSITGSATLEFLRIKFIHMKHPRLHLRTFPPSLHIFEYRAFYPFPEDIAALVFSQANQFTSLSLPVFIILAGRTDSSTSNFHKLQKLTVVHYHKIVLSSSIVAEKFSNFFSLMPNLRELHMIVNLSPPTNLDSAAVFSPTLLRNLESLTAPPSMANDIISFGPPLKKIHIFAIHPNEFPNDFKLISKGVKYVAYDGPLEDPEKELTHLARMFPNATSVQITATRQHRATHEEIFDVVLSILPDLPYLKQCGVFDLLGHPTDLERHRTAGFHCPVGRAADSKYRAHPMLEDVQILSWYRWIWIPEDGWRACDLHYAPVNLLRTF